MNVCLCANMHMVSWNKTELKYGVHLNVAYVFRVQRCVIKNFRTVTILFIGIGT